MRTFFLFLFIFFHLISPNSSFAHPLDEIGDIKTYDQKQTLEVDNKNVKLTIDVTLYALDKVKVWESIDKNRNREVTAAEKDEWARKGSRSSWLSVNGDRIDFSPASLEFPDYFEFFSPAPAKFTIEFIAAHSFLSNQSITYHYLGKDQKLESLDFAARGLHGLQVVNLTKTTPDSATFQIVAGDNTEGEVLGLSKNTKLEEFLNTYVKTDNLPISFIFLALFSAFAIGALHALTPGHGKAMVAGYLVGSRGTVLHALYLGLIITITHTSVVFLLGFLALFATQYFVAAKVIQSLTFFSGLLVFVFGLYLIFKRSKKLFRRTQDKSHDHNHHPHQITWKNLLPLGFSGGLVPCVDALAILIVAISLGKTIWGVALLIVFSAGLAVALTAAGVLAVIAKDKVTQKITSLDKFESAISLVSAVVVTVLGFAMMIRFIVIV